MVGNSQGIVLMDMPLEDLLTRARVLADDDAVAQNLPRINQVLGELDALGLTPLVKDLAARRLRDDQIDTELTSNRPKPTTLCCRVGLPRCVS